MNGGMIGKCEVCGKDGQSLMVTTFEYNLKCECHSPIHFEAIHHCPDCIPVEPGYTRIHIKTEVLRRLLDEARPVEKIFEEILAERQRQDEKWGEQNHPMRGVSFDKQYGERVQFPPDSALRKTLEAYKERNGSDKKGWFDILIEEICEAFLETNPKRQREEMIQVAAVAVAIIESLDNWRPE